MKKIPTLFVRDPEDRSRVTNEVTPGCEWVLAGEGRATLKYDGTCCLIRDGKLYKRREVKPGKIPPINFELVDEDSVTGKRVGWVPVGDGPEDKWHRQALNYHIESGLADEPTHGDGTYELMGPKIQGNPFNHEGHQLHRHGLTFLTEDGARTLRGPESIRRYLLEEMPERFEGIVWHHPDGRMAKIKRRDFR